ncbi:MAG TPA: DNA gyrase modulator, partial [Candidatus Nitrosotalea sp.]|nr:DNA gyrase modulator [Candidatus Nitrosotalea sp.]
MSLEDYAEKALQIALDAGSQYCDVRAESTTTRGFVIENGEVENFVSSGDSGLGIRVLVNGAWGFYSTLSPKSFDALKENIIGAVKAARYYSESKKNKVRLADIRSFTDTVDCAVRVTPSIDEMMKIGLESDKIIRDNQRIIKSSVSIHHDKFHKYFVNSEGSKITQNFDDVMANLTATAHYSGLTESVNTTEGGRGGLEMITGNNDLFTISKSISDKADALLDAKTAKEEKATVVMNPDFVALLSHEILGHP